MDRLSAIKEALEQTKPLHGELLEDFKWLIQQAAQLERLQKQTLYSDFINRINELEEEIKYLHQARKENRSGSQHETHPVLDRGAE